MEIKPLFWDTEFSRSVVEGYGTKWEYKVVKIVRQQRMMCYAYAFGDDPVTFVGRHQFRTYKAFLQSLADILSKAYIDVAHNGVRFDNPMVNTQFTLHGIPIPSPHQSVDTLLIARRLWKFPSNSLKDLGQFLGLGDKEEITYADLEDEYMTANPSKECIDAMERYTKKDVELVRKIYYVERPSIKTHPNMATLSGKGFACPRCAGTSLQARGKRYTNVNVYQQYRCNNCGHWSRERVAEPEHVKPELT